MRRGLTAALVAAVVLATPAQAAATTAGWLDPSFSGDGLVVVPSVTSGRDSEALPDANVIQTASGRIYVFTARYPKDPPGWTGSALGWLELTAFKTNGALDPAFHGGRPAVVVRSGRGVGAIEGPFVPVSGRATVAFSQLASMLAERWTTSGNVDTTFSGDGRFGFGLPGGVTVLPGGSTRAVRPSSPEPVLDLVGLNPTGALDTRVGPGGVRLVVNASVLRSWITSDATGRLTIASLQEGLAENHLVIQRLSSSGATITTWGTAGATELAFQPVSSAILTMVVGPDGSTYIGTSTDVGGHSRATIAKLDPTGQPDAAFGIGGVLVVPTAAPSRLQDMIVLDGRLILSYVAGSGATRQPALARLDATDGALDPAFGHGGIIPTANLATGLAAAGPGSSDFLTVSRSGGTSNAQIILARRNG